jgi:hypothetical protein
VQGPQFKLSTAKKKKKKKKTQTPTGINQKLLKLTSGYNKD